VDGEFLLVLVVAIVRCTV